MEGMNLREVAPYLYVGEQTAPLRGNWHTVIDFYGNAPYYVRPAYKDVKNYVRIPFDDGDVFPDDALEAAWEAWQTAEDEGGETLIHCQAGLSRSASAAYALMRLRYGLDHDTALARVVTPYTAHQYPMRLTLASAYDWVKRQRT
jgi:protein-tyrosine phosphatase